MVKSNSQTWQSSQLQLDKQETDFEYVDGLLINKVSVLLL